MFGLFYKKKVHLSRADFITLMLSLQQKRVAILLRVAQQHLQPNPDAETLRLECEVLSLWILSLAIQDNDLKNVIHDEYCRHMDFDKDTIKQFYVHLNMRYKQYYEAFKEYITNEDRGAGGMVLGSVVANGLKGGESDKLETNIMKTFTASSTVINIFTSTLEFIGGLKKKYDLSEVSSVFVK